MHRITKDRVERKIISTRATLIGCEDEDCFHRSVLTVGIADKFDLGHSRSGSTDIARRCAHQQILPGPVNLAD